MKRLAPWLFWSLGLAMAFRPALLSGFRELQINPGDPRLVHYVLEHTWLWMQGAALHGGLWDPPVFYPATGVGGYSDTLLGTAPFYAVWRVLGLAEGASFQLWMMSCLSLCYASAYWFLRRGLGFESWPAAVGAFFGGFTIVRLANFNSPHFFTVFWASFAFGALARALSPDARRPAAWILVFGACVALQVWSAFYPGFFLFLVLSTATLAALCWTESRKRLTALCRAHPLALAAAVLLGAAALAPLALAHWRAAAEVGWRGTGVVSTSQPPLASWIYPGGKNLLYGALKHLELFQFPQGTSFQNSNGVGFVTTVVFLVGLVRARRPVARVALATLLVLILVTTRFPGELSLWNLIYAYVPGAKAARYPACIGMYVPVAVSLGLASFASLRDERRGALAASLALFCCLEQFTALEHGRQRLFVGPDHPHDGQRGNDVALMVGRRRRERQLLSRHRALGADPQGVGLRENDDPLRRRRPDGDCPRARPGGQPDRGHVAGRKLYRIRPDGRGVLWGETGERYVWTSPSRPRGGSSPRPVSAAS